MSEEHDWEIKQLAYEYQNKYDKSAQYQAMEKELEEYKKLVERQNRALKSQDQEC